MKRKRVTEKTINSIKTLNDLGMTASQISKALVISKTVIYTVKRTGFSFEAYQNYKQDRVEKLKESPSYQNKHTKTNLAKVNKKNFALVKTLVDAGLEYRKISDIVKLSRSTIGNIATSDSLEDYKEKMARYAQNKAKTVPEVEAGKVKEEEKTATMSFNQYNSLMVKLNAIHYDVVALKNKKGLIF